jgi:hypothetical protein
LTDPVALIVSPYFPPSTLAGVHRARHLAKHLPAHGWRPIVLSANPAGYSEPGDPELAALVPAELSQVRTAALPARLSRAFGVGDIGLRAYPFLTRALTRTIRRESPSVIFITGSPFYPLLLARGVKRRFGLPVVLDFQDPWVSAFGATHPPFSKPWMAHRLAILLEPRAVRAADMVTSVSETQNAEMRDRYSWLDPSRMAAIPIGGDPEDFLALRNAPRRLRVIELPPDVLNFSYVGAFLPRAAPLARELFLGIRRLRTDHPDLAARLRFNFIGTSNQPGGHGAYMVRPFAEEAGVADLVRETPQRVPFLDALSVLANSHALLMIGSDEPHYTASKIYPGLMSGRPFLSIYHARSSAHGILVKAGGGQALGFETSEQLESLPAAIAEALRLLAQKPNAFGRVDPTAYAPYTAQAVAGQFAEVFDRVSGRT